MERTVLFLHAYPLHAGLWKRQLETLPHGWAGLAPDFPGFGGMPPGPRSLEGFARDVLDMLDRSGIDRFVAVGLSMGGYVAFRLAELVPDRLEGLVLCDTRADPDTLEARRRRTDQVDRVREEGITWLADSMIPVLLGESTRRDNPGVEVHVRELIDAADPEGVARAILALRDRPDSTPLLGRLAMPTLCVVGDEDSVTPATEMEAMAARIPGASLKVLSGAGHLSNLEAPDAFDATLRGFLESLPAR
jgi:3-oxoadipate enol-lactonase